MLVCSLRITGQKGRSTSEMNVPIQNTDDNIPTVCFEVFKMNVPVIDMHMQCFIFQFYSMLLTGSSMSGAFSPTWEVVPGGMLFPKQQPFYSTKNQAITSKLNYAMYNQKKVLPFPKNCHLSMELLSGTYFTLTFHARDRFRQSS